MKLKQLLEGYAWERNADGSLPTLSDAVTKHAQNIKEQNDEVNSDSVISEAYDKIVDAYKQVTENMDEEQARKVSQQIIEYFS
jgi:Mg2+ and Co2+ transporter CorA